MARREDSAGAATIRIRKVCSKIGCRNCGSKTRAARWTECDNPPLQHEEEEARVRKELDEMMCYVKQLAEAINMSKEELVRMIQE